jgi:Domain of unknown function (DUF4349)
MPGMNEETTTILIDTALAADAATALDPEERALQELVLAIRDDVPVPASDFRVRMDARVAAGFPSHRKRAIALPRLALRRPRLAALGVAASLLIALVVAVSLATRSNERSATPAAGAAPHAAVQPEVPAGKAAAGAPAPQSATRSASTLPAITPIEPPIDSSVVRGGRNRRVERSAALVLAAPEDRFSEVGDQIVAVTDRYRGIVMHSSVTDTGNGAGSGAFDLRIPVRNLRSALRDLSALADVQSRTENADDVTASFVGARSRIEELTAERKRLLAQLAKATSDNQAAAIRTRIRIVNGQLDEAVAALRRLSRRTAFASVSVTLTVKRGGSATGSGGIGGGLRDMRDTLVDSAAIALRVLGVLIPIAMVIALLGLGNAWLTRRRREAALDSRL